MVHWEQIFLLKQSIYWNQKCNNKILWSGFEPCILLFISTALHSWVIQPIEYAGLYVVNLTFRYNYAHLSRSPLCHRVSYWPSLATGEELLLQIEA